MRSDLTESELDELLNSGRYQVHNFTILNVCEYSELVTSKSDAKKLITSGGFYVNNIRKLDPYECITKDDVLFNRYILVRKGKREYRIIDIKNSLINII